MSDGPTPLVKTLISARRGAGLSQHALGEKVGLAQSHISKIERAAVDPQLSNVVEIGRALGLELMLVPRHLIPAVRSLQRQAFPDPTRPAGGPAYRLDDADA